jgi:hypothetical protein
LGTCNRHGHRGCKAAACRHGAPATAVCNRRGPRRSCLSKLINFQTVV